MTDTAQAAVHDLVGFLAAFDPTALQQLQRQHPGEPMLRPGRTLGELAPPAGLRLALARQGLQAMLAHGDALADRLARRVRNSHRLELLAQLVALLGSGGLLALLLGQGSAAMQMAGAVLALAGSATAVVVKFLRRDLGVRLAGRQVTLAAWPIARRGARRRYSPAPPVRGTPRMRGRSWKWVSQSMGATCSGLKASARLRLRL